MPFEIDPNAISAFLQVVLIDVVLSGDNAVVIGMAVAALPAADRKRIIAIGILAATVLRIIFASVAVPLLKIIGLTLGGGILLAWVAWKMWRELRQGAQDVETTGEEPDYGKPAQQKTRMQAVIQVVIADVSMSLDNVLAVAGAAREHPYILVIGLILSIALMAVAANIVARLLNRYSWIAYVGLAVIVYVALDMIWRGGNEVLKAASTML